MAHRLFAKGLNFTPSKIKQIRQQFNYLLILDFESTCAKNVALVPQEIIEIPCLAVNTEDWQVDDVFHQYVKPRVHPILTPFCTDLTGIMQETVDKQPEFPRVFEKFNEWLVKGGFIHDDSGAFVTCGDWDLRVMLPSQCKLDGLAVPKHFQKWIDLKRIYCEMTGHYPRSLKNMLVRSNISLEGKLHSGICDTQNMMKIIMEMQEQYNPVFRITSRADEKIAKEAII